MAKRQLRADDVDGFMLAFWDEWVDQERAFEVQVQVSIIRLPGRGRFRLVAEGLRETDNLSLVARGRGEVEWPTSKSESVHAALYALLCRLWADMNVERREKLLEQLARKV